jgi:tetratricopeptide (TPR) repeat protein
LPLGADLIRAGQYAPGIQILHNLLRQNPNIDQAYISLADAARRTRKTAEEVEALQGLERHNPRYPMLHLLIAQAMLRGAHPDYAGILRELSLAETSAPSDADVFYLRGKVLIALKRYREAVSTLNQAAELRPMDVSTYYQLARLYRKLGKDDMAAKQFRKVKYIEGAATK